MAELEHRVRSGFHGVLKMDSNQVQHGEYRIAVGNLVLALPLGDSQRQLVITGHLLNDRKVRGRRLGNRQDQVGDEIELRVEVSLPAFDALAVRAG